jgi:hypothetical protein
VHPPSSPFGVHSGSFRVPGSSRFTCVNAMGAQGLDRDFRPFDQYGGVRVVGR